MSQVKAGLKEPNRFLGRNLDDVFDHWPSNPTRPWGRGGRDRGECSLDLLDGEGSRRAGCGPWGERTFRSWGPRRGLREEGVCEQLSPLLGVLARPSGPLRGGTGVERVPEPHLASFQMLSGEADSQILV